MLFLCLWLRRSQMRSAVLAASNHTVLSLGEADGAPCFGIRPGPLPGSAAPNTWKNVPFGCSDDNRVTLPPSWASIHFTRRWVSLILYSHRVDYCSLRVFWSLLQNINLNNQNHWYIYICIHVVWCCLVNYCKHYFPIVRNWQLVHMKNQHWALDHIGKKVLSVINITNVFKFLSKVQSRLPQNCPPAYRLPLVSRGLIYNAVHRVYSK